MAIPKIVLDEFNALLIPLEEHALQASLEDKFLVGYHDGCTGFNGHRKEMYAQYHSSTHNCLVCQGCQLRIIVPNGILPLVITHEVFESLRKWLIQTMKQKRLAKEIMQNPGLYQVLLASTIDA